MKLFISHIVFKYGEIYLKPISHTLNNGVIVKLKKESNDSLELNCSFENTNLTKEEAFNISNNIAESLSLSLSLINKIGHNLKPNTKSVWQEIGSKKSQNTASFTTDCTLKGSMQINLNNKLIADSLDISNSHKHKQSLDCFNKALNHKERDSNDKSTISIWLRLSWEALQMELPHKGSQTKDDILSRKVLSKEQFNDFKLTIEHYVHHDKNYSQNKIISIEECINHMRTILMFYCEAWLIN